MGTWGLGVGLGDNPLGFGGWDMGTWGLGVGLGDNPLGFGGWDRLLRVDICIFCILMQMYNFNKGYPVSVQMYTPNLIHATHILNKQV